MTQDVRLRRSKKGLVVGLAVAAVGVGVLIAVLASGGEPTGKPVAKAEVKAVLAAKRWRTRIAGRSADQDMTPAPAGESIHDLMSNAQEWTADLWRESSPGGDESWVQDGATSFRAVRGLPLDKAPPNPMPAEGAAYRDALCATGPCVEGAREAYRFVGFRCVRAAARR